MHFHHRGLEITECHYEKAAMHGVSRANLRRRVRDYGWTIDEAISTPIGERSKKQDPYKEMALKNGININCYLTRLAGGMSKEKAATMPLNPHLWKPSPKEQMYLEIALKNGISRETFLHRIRSGKFDLERAATQKKHPPGKYKRRMLSDEEKRRRNRGFGM